MAQAFVAQIRASIVIQSAARMWSARAHVRVYAARAHAAAQAIQCAWRWYGTQQRVQKRALARRIAWQQQVLEATIRVQSVVRRFLAERAWKRAQRAIVALQVRMVGLHTTQSANVQGWCGVAGTFTELVSSPQSASHCVGGTLRARHFGKLIAWYGSSHRNEVRQARIWRRRVLQVRRMLATRRRMCWTIEGANSSRWGTMNCELQDECEALALACVPPPAPASGNQSAIATASACAAQCHSGRCHALSSNYCDFHAPP